MKFFFHFFALVIVSVNLIPDLVAEEIRDPTCEIRLKPAEGKDYKAIYDVVFEKLRERGFAPIESDSNRVPWPKGTLYLLVEKRMEGKNLYPPCLLNLKFKQQEGSVTTAKDKTLYEYEARRAYPRVTREGISRCKLAARDAFAFAPICSKIP